MTTSEDMIDRIVASVLEQLRQPSDAAPSTAIGGESARSAASNPSNDRSVPTAVEINDDVITGILLENRGVISRSVVFGANSVLTPSAREFLSQRKIEWTRAPAGAKATGWVATWLAIVVRSTPAVMAALDAVAKDAAVLWRRELLDCHREAAARGIGALCRGEADGVVVFTGKPESVACRTNRNQKVRAAAVTTVARTVKIREQMGTNLLAINPTQMGIFELQKLLRAITSGSKPAIPADWNE